MRERERGKERGKGKKEGRKREKEKKIIVAAAQDIWELSWPGQEGLVPAKSWLALIAEPWC